MPSFLRTWWFQWRGIPDPQIISECGSYLDQIKTSAETFLRQQSCCAVGSTEVVKFCSDFTVGVKTVCNKIANELGGDWNHFAITEDELDQLCLSVAKVAIEECGKRAQSHLGKATNRRTCFRQLEVEVESLLELFGSEIRSKLASETGDLLRFAAKQLALRSVEDLSNLALGKDSCCEPFRVANELVEQYIVDSNMLDKLHLTWSDVGSSSEQFRTEFMQAYVRKVKKLDWPTLESYLRNNEPIWSFLHRARNSLNACEHYLRTLERPLQKLGLAWEDIGVRGGAKEEVLYRAALLYEEFLPYEKVLPKKIPGVTPRQPALSDWSPPLYEDSWHYE